MKTPVDHRWKWPGWAFSCAFWCQRCRPDVWACRSNRYTVYQQLKPLQFSQCRNSSTRDWHFSSFFINPYELQNCWKCPENAWFASLSRVYCVTLKKLAQQITRPKSRTCLRAQRREHVRWRRWCEAADLEQPDPMLRNPCLVPKVSDFKAEKNKAKNKANTLGTVGWYGCQGILERIWRLEDEESKLFGDHVMLDVNNTKICLYPNWCRICLFVVQHVANSWRISMV